MGLDIRLPIGILLLLVGIQLIAFGLLSDPALYRRSLGINVNIGWGSGLAAAGLIFLAAARRGSKGGGQRR